MICIGVRAAGTFEEPSLAACGSTLHYTVWIESLSLLSCRKQDIESGFTLKTND